MTGAKRSEFMKYLPSDISKDRLQEMKKEAVCALTGSAVDVTLDHFIPLEWGHGGEYVGNVYYLARRLNATKSNMNPFRWIHKAKLREPSILPRWDDLIRRLAAENGLSTKEFRRFVHWCEKHKRSPDQLRSDPRRSLELWKATRDPGGEPARGDNDR